MLEADATPRQAVNVRRLEMVRTITTDITNAQIIGQDENDVWLSHRIGPGLGRQRDKPHRQQQRKNSEGIGFHRNLLADLMDGRRTDHVTVLIGFIEDH